MKKLIVVSWMALFLTISANANYLGHESAQNLIDELTSEFGFDRETVESVLADADHVPKIIELMTRPAESISWHKYKDIFLQPDRMNAGVEFIRNHQEQLLLAEEKFQVPAHIISAIIGVETFYGKYLGTYRVLDALATLGFDYPKRAPFFRSELKHFLILACEERIKPFDADEACDRTSDRQSSGKGRTIDELVGSYAGAMGYGQFIPSSYRNFAIDFNEDGIRDIWTDKTDAIGSVANYFARHGWELDGPVLEYVTVAAPIQSSLVQLANSDLKPNKTVQEWRGLGIRSTAPDLASAALFSYKLDEENNDRSNEYILGFDNFYVITRYNRSRLYARVVYQLAMDIRANL